MNFEFAKYTEVTDLAFHINPEYQNAGYTRIFICPDVNDAHLIRVLPGYGYDYEKANGSCIVERNIVPNRFKGQKMTEQRAVLILTNDEFDNWDYHVLPNDIKEVLSVIDNGFGILNLKEETQTA